MKLTQKAVLAALLAIACGNAAAYSNFVCGSGADRKRVAWQDTNVNIAIVNADFNPWEVQRLRDAILQWGSSNIGNTYLNIQRVTLPSGVETFMELVNNSSDPQYTKDAVKRNEMYNDDYHAIYRRGARSSNSYFGWFPGEAGNGQGVLGWTELRYSNGGCFSNTTGERFWHPSRDIIINRVNLGGTDSAGTSNPAGHGGLQFTQWQDYNSSQYVTDLNRMALI